MKILVLMKQVANKDAVLRINKDSTWIEEADLSFEVNESDGYALEEALRIREKVGTGEVVVVSMGPPRAKSVIKDALARGADRAIHVLGDNVVHLSPFAAAAVLAEAIRDENADLVMTGHLLGAAGGVEGVFSVLSIHRSLLLPTINYEQPDPDCDLDYVPNQAREATIKYALSNSFGFGGTNAALLFKRYEE